MLWFRMLCWVHVVDIIAATFAYTFDESIVYFTNNWFKNVLSDSVCPNFKKKLIIVYLLIVTIEML